MIVDWKKQIMKIKMPQGVKVFKGVSREETLCCYLWNSRWRTESKEEDFEFRVTNLFRRDFTEFNICFQGTCGVTSYPSKGT